MSAWRSHIFNNIIFSSAVSQLSRIYCNFLCLFYNFFNIFKHLYKKKYIKNSLIVNYWIIIVNYDRRLFFYSKLSIYGLILLFRLVFHFPLDLRTTDTASVFRKSIITPWLFQWCFHGTISHISIRNLLYGFVQMSYKCEFMSKSRKKKERKSIRKPKKKKKETQTIL